MIHDLIKFLSVKDNYDKCIKFVQLDTLPDEVKTLIQFIKEWFDTSGKQEIPDTYKDLYVAYSLRHPGYKNMVLLESLCNALDAHKSVPIGDSIAQIFIDRSFAERIADEASKIADGNSSGEAGFRKLDKIFNEYKTQSVRLDKALKDLEVDDMYSSLFSKKIPGYSWRMNCLNTILGEISTQFIIVAARPDGGKTTFFSQEAWWIAKQLPKDRIVLWFNNEEAISEVKKRVVQSALGVTRAWLEANRIEALRRFKRLLGGDDRIVFVDNAHDMKIIDKGIEKYNPGLIIIDQLFKVKDIAGGGDIDAEKFRIKCAYAREIAKHVAPVLASNQLDAQAEGIKYPSMDCLYGSKTGAQGEADAILLIGRSYAEPDKRFIYTPKNKLTGSNEKYEVILEKEIARYS